MRTSPVHYIAPSAISITPNANNSHRDLAVYVARGATIKVYCPRAGIGRDDDEGDYQEFPLSGRNRRLADQTGTIPYTIYALIRRPIGGVASAYLVFAAKEPRGGEWHDKYPYPTPDGMSEENWFGSTYVRLGDVSEAVSGERSVTLDTGILGTDQYNNVWTENPDLLPLRIELGCTINDEDVGLNPYVYWGQSLVLTATLTEGWTGTDIKRFHHWEISRKTDSDPQENRHWLDGDEREDAFAESGEITLRHLRNADDFNGAVATTFTVMAMEVNPEYREDEQDEDIPPYLVLKSATITILAETIEKYELALSEHIVSYSPQTGGYTPADSVTVGIRATNQRSDVSDLTNGEVDMLAISVKYAPVGAESEATVIFPGAADAVAAGAIPVSTAFAAQKSVNVRLVRTVTVAAGDGEGEEPQTEEIELASTTIAFVRDGEDSREREWIFLRSATEIDFGTQGHPLPSSIDYGEVHPAAAAGHVTDDKDQEGWVPEGWWDEMQGTDDATPYEYGAYRDYIHEYAEDNDDGGHWGPFSIPRIWSHYGKNGVDAQDIEWAYIRTKTNTAPVIADDSSYTDHNGKGYSADDHLPHVTGNANIENNSNAYECTDDPKGVNDTWPYEWEIKREKGTADANGHRAWLPYSGTMTLHNNMAESALTIDIDNDSDQFGVDADGRVVDAQARSTNVTMLYGTQEQEFTPQQTISLKYDDGSSVPSTVATATIAPVSGSNNRQYLVTVTVRATGSNAPVFGDGGHSGLYVDVTGTCTRGTKTIRFTLAKVMGGAQGVSPTIYQLNPTVKSFSFARDDSNNLTPNSISSQINVAETVGNTTTQRTSPISGITYSWGFDSEAAQASGRAIGTSITVTNTDAATRRNVWVQLSTGDRETLPIVKDGAGGKDVGINLLDGTNLVINKDRWNMFNGTVQGGGAMGQKCFFNDSTAGSSYADVLRQTVYGDDVQRLMPATWYTLSFWLRGSGTATSFVYPSCVDRTAGCYMDGTFVETANVDGSMSVPATDTWTRHTYTFKTLATFNPTQYFLLRAQNGAAVYFSAMKVELGMTATDWCLSEADRIGQDGENAVRLALDNEHEDFVYDDAGSNKSGSATSQARLYDGTADKTGSVTEWRVSANGGTTWGTSVGSNSGDTADASISTAGLLTVSGLLAATGKVKVRARYNDVYHYADFTGNKTTQDKYELQLSPSSIAFNPASYTTQAISIKVQRTDLLGNKTNPTISTTLNSGNLRVFMAYVQDNGTLGTMSRVTGTSMSVTGNDCNSCIGIYFELRYYFNSDTPDSGASSTYRVCDYETVEIAKASNGNNTTIVPLYKRQKSSDAAPSSGPSLTLYYKFSTHKLYTDAACTTEFTTSTTGGGGWGMGLPASEAGKKIYVTYATAYAQGDTDDIAQGEWSGPVLHNENVLTQTVRIYKRSATAPAETPAASKDAPADGATYTFATGALTGTLNGWSTDIPATDGNPCYERHATAAADASSTSDTINRSEWSEASKVMEDGQPGVSYLIRTNPASIVIPPDVDSVTVNEISGSFFKRDADGIEEQLYTAFVLWQRDKNGSHTALLRASNVYGFTYNVPTAVTSDTEAFVVCLQHQLTNDPDVYYERLEIPVRKQGDTGGKGDDAVTYGIVFDSYSASHSTDNKQLTWSATCRVVKTTGSATEYTTDGIMQYSYDNGAWDGLTKRTDDYYIPQTTVSNLTTPKKSINFRYVLDGTVLATASQPISIIGATGVGKTGRMYYIAGQWDSSKEYKRTDDLCPVVYYGTKWWYLKYGTDTGHAPADGSDYWGEVADFGVVLTDAIFVKQFAQFGSAIITGDWLISLHGTINGTPYGGTVENPDMYNGQAAYTWFDCFFPTGPGTSYNILASSVTPGNIEKVVPNSSFTGVSYQAITEKFRLMGGRSYTIKVTMHVSNANYRGYVRLGYGSVYNMVSVSTRSTDDVTLTTSAQAITETRDDYSIAALLQYNGDISSWTGVYNAASVSSYSTYMNDNNYVPFYKRLAGTQPPSAPTGTSSSPSGWSRYVPSGSDTLWVAFGYKSDTGSASMTVSSIQFIREDNYMFIPNWCVDLKTGLMVAARGNFVVQPNGDVRVDGTIRAKSMETSFVDLTYKYFDAAHTQPINNSGSIFKLGTEVVYTAGGQAVNISGVYNFMVGNTLFALPADERFVSQRVLIYNNYARTAGGTSKGATIASYYYDEMDFTESRKLRGVGIQPLNGSSAVPSSHVLPSGAAAPLWSYTDVRSLYFANGVVEVVGVPSSEEGECEWAVVNIGTNCYLLQE